MDEPTLRLRLLIAYDGHGFRGWQSQSGGGAVQDALEAAFAEIVGSRVVVLGSGRTDTGVHALGQVGHADVPAARLPLGAWLAAINGNLPRTVRVLRVTQAAPDFHARFSARGKVYTYRIHHGPVMHPLELNRAWHLPGPCDMATLKAGAAILTGTHDYASFAANRGKPEKTTVRTIHSIRITKRGPVFAIRFEGTGFLYRMVRLLAGSMVRCAQGKADMAWMAELLGHPGGRKNSYMAPAAGLYLTRVLY